MAIIEHIHLNDGHYFFSQAKQYQEPIQIPISSLMPHQTGCRWAGGILDCNPISKWELKQQRNKGDPKYIFRKGKKEPTTTITTENNKKRRTDNKNVQS